MVVRTANNRGDIILIWIAIILGIVQGITEFLPISSTGHLIIIENYLKLSNNREFTNMFEVVIQSGSIIAVIWYFRKKIFPRKTEIKPFTLDNPVYSLWLKIIIAFIPAAITGVLFHDIIDELLFNPFYVSIALITGGILILIAETKKLNIKTETKHQINYKQSVLVGIFQCLALWPGMSRSASSIIGGLFSGFNRKTAAEFSFFLAIPTLLGATCYKLLKSGMDFNQQEWLVLGIGTIVTFIISWIVIALFMNFIKKHSLSVFAYYRIALGLILIVVKYYV
jgi:undecaprenyl-diphosphatase